MTALEMKQPGIIFRGAILFAQGTPDRYIVCVIDQA